MYHHKKKHETRADRITSLFIQKRMGMHKLNQVDLAQLTHIGQGRISRMLSGEHRWALRDVVRLMDILDHKKIERFLGEMEKEIGEKNVEHEILCKQSQMKQMAHLLLYHSHDHAPFSEVVDDSSEFKTDDARSTCRLNRCFPILYSSSGNWTQTSFTQDYITYLSCIQGQWRMAETLRAA